MSGRDALASAGLAPVTLAPKEGLALINGTQPSTAVAALAVAGRRAPRARGRHRRGAVDRRAAWLDRAVRSAHPRRAAARRPACVGFEHPGSARRERHQPVARALRARAGRLFAAVRGAGARRRARRAQLRAPTLDDRGQRRHRQPDGVRRVGRHRVGRQLSRRAGRDRGRSVRHRARAARDDQRAAVGSPRGSGAERSARVPHAPTAGSTRAT